jgi:hypothetical protein
MKSENISYVEKNEQLVKEKMQIERKVTFFITKLYFSYKSYSRHLRIAR